MLCTPQGFHCAVEAQRSENSTSCGQDQAKPLERAGLQPPHPQSPQHLSEWILSLFQPEVSGKVSLQPGRADDFRLCLSQVCSVRAEEEAQHAIRARSGWGITALTKQ